MRQPVRRYAALDLHLHSTASDGLPTPAEVVGLAAVRGVSTIALCDHDTVAGVGPALAAAAQVAPAVTVIPAVELTCYWRERSVHLLGYGFDAAAPELAADLAQRRHVRQRHIDRILARLAELGHGLEPARLVQLSGGAVIGRPLIARALVDAGHAPDVKSAWDGWLRKGRPAYFQPDEPQSPLDAIALLHRVGAVAVLAHPRLDRNEELLDELAAGGLDGLEAWHARHDADDTARLLATAQRLDLLVTGGTDSHGRTDAPGLGELPVPDSVLPPLRAALACRRAGLGGPASSP